MRPGKGWATLLVTFHIVPDIGILLLPVWLALTLLLAMGIGLYASALMVTYRNAGCALPVVTQLLLYGSPVAYAL